MGSYNFDEGHPGDLVPDDYFGGGLVIYDTHAHGGSGLSGYIDPNWPAPNNSSLWDRFVEQDGITAAAGWIRPKGFASSVHGTDGRVGLQIYLDSDTQALAGELIFYPGSPTLLGAFPNSGPEVTTHFESGGYPGQWLQLRVAINGLVTVANDAGVVLASLTVPAIDPAKFIDFFALKDNTGAGYVDDFTWTVGQPVVRKHPRDDGAGYSASPRIHPPPKSGRIVGRYQ